jgi:polysaccharide biosynthesis PFTS motif protein
MSVVNFICWGFKAILPCISGLFGKKWWHPLLFSSFVESYLIRNQKELAKNYFFHNGGRYRPLWTYETEKRGARNTYYFLSTNNAAFKEKNGKTSPLPYKKFMLWNDYLVWDKVQKKAVKSNIQNKAIENKAKIRIVGPISLLDSGSEIPNFSKPAVAVFDIPARKPRIFASFASPTNYYTSNIVNKFLSDIQNVTENEKWMMIWKGKKTSENLKDKNLDPIYTSYLAKLRLHKNVVLLDPNIAAERIIKKVLLVISIPFTSTALIGSYLKKPSIYYDPMFFCKKNDEAAHGIKIIQGKNELQNYLKTLRD